MENQAVQSGRDPATGHFKFFGGFKGLGMYGLLLLGLTCALFLFEVSSVGSLLLFPVILALAILGGLLFQMAGALTGSLVVLLPCAYALFAKVSWFGALPRMEAVFFFLGFGVLVFVFSLAAALAVGYTRRTTELAVQRQGLLNKELDALRSHEALVSESEQDLHLALHNAQMGFWHQNRKTKEVRCSESWYELLNMTRSPGKSPIDLWKSRLHPDDYARVRDIYRDYYCGGEGSLRVDYRILKGSSHYIWVQETVRISEYNSDGSPLRVIGTTQDVSEQKQSELELKKAKEHAEAANQAKGQFIATVSHEIRTPLNAIIGLSSFLTEGELDGEQLDLAQTIHSSGRSLLLLVNDILDFSKIEAGRLDLEEQEFPLLLAFEDSAKLFRLKAAEKAIRLAVDLASDLTEFALGDMERLRQIVQNLLANAIKFTDSGEVRLSVRQVNLCEIEEANRPDPNLALGYLDGPDRDYMEVSVQDTGIGIPAEMQHNLFEAFTQVDASTTRKYGGTGLGLVICQRLVEAMGGRIWVESAAGQGSCFHFVVRTKLIRQDHSLSAMAWDPHDSVQRIADQHPCDILVVGPDEATLPILLSCRQLGYAPHSTEDYDLSSSAFRRRTYGLVFIWMGEELRALELARKISATGHILRPDRTVGYAPPEQKISKDRCRLNGMDEVIQKKICPLQLRELILNVLGGRG